LTSNSRRERRGWTWDPAISGPAGTVSPSFCHSHNLRMCMWIISNVRQEIKYFCIPLCLSSYHVVSDQRQCCWESDKYRCDAFSVSCSLSLPFVDIVPSWEDNFSWLESDIYRFPMSIPCLLIEPPRSICQVYRISPYHNRFVSHPP